MNTDSKANPEFIKPKRREMSYCKDNHICVYGSDYHFAKSLSCTMRNVEQNTRICLLMGTWLEILDVAHVIMCGDDRFILCADDHHSASFASLYCFATCVGICGAFFIPVTYADGNVFLFLYLPYILKECHLTNVNLFVRVSVHRPPRSYDCDVFRFLCYCDGDHPAVGRCAAHHTVVLCKSNLTV